MVKLYEIGGAHDAPKFNKAIQEHPAALVLVHSPGCGHCIAMMPEWKKLRTTLSKMSGNMAVYSVNVGALSGIKHPALQSISEFPTIMAIKEDRSVVPFEGERTMANMLKFSQNNFGLAKKTKKTKKRKSKKSKKSKKGGQEEE